MDAATGFQGFKFFFTLVMMTGVPAMGMLFILFRIAAARQGERLQMLPASGRRRLRAWMCGSLAYVSGVLAAFVWLPWSAGRGLGDVFAYGPPDRFAAWQYIGLLLTVVVVSAALTLSCRHIFFGASVVAVWMALGVSTFVALGAAFATSELRGVWAVVDCLALSLGLLILNSVVNQVSLRRS